MNTRAKNCLVEALRRYHSFHAQESPLKAWTGLGFPTEYRDAVKLGYMVPVHSIEPRVLSWYRLTEQGLAVALRLANEGYRVHDYQIVHEGVKL